MDPSCQLKADGTPYAHMFCLQPSALTQGQIMASFALKNGLKTFGVLYNQENAYSVSLLDPFLDTLSEGRFCNTARRVCRTPGHTPGHVALYEPDSKSLFTGDTLFRESIGRTDLPGGDYSWIMRSILDSLIPLGEEVHIYPGHGPESTIGHETLYNPFIVEVLNEEINYRN